jgi:hypothetical protein
MLMREESSKTSVNIYQNTRQSTPVTAVGTSILYTLVCYFRNVCHSGLLTSFRVTESLGSLSKVHHQVLELPPDESSSRLPDPPPLIILPCTVSCPVRFHMFLCIRDELCCPLTVHLVSYACLTLHRFTSFVLILSSGLCVWCTYLSCRRRISLHLSAHLVLGAIVPSISQ